MQTFAAVVFTLAQWFVVSNAIPRITRWQHIATFGLCAVGTGTIAHFLIGALFK